MKLLRRLEYEPQEIGFGYFGEKIAILWILFCF